MGAAGGITSNERVALQLDIDGFVAEIENILQSGVDPALYSGFTLGNLASVSLSGSSTLLYTSAWSSHPACFTWS